MEDLAYKIISESLKDELRAPYLYLLAADVAPTPAARFAARQFAREEEEHFDDLVEWIEWEDDPELQAALQKIRLLQYEQSPQTDTVRQWLETCRYDDVAETRCRRSLSWRLPKNTSPSGIITLWNDRSKSRWPGASCMRFVRPKSSITDC